MNHVTRIRNPEPGTRNSERGLSLVTAIFLMVVLAMLGAYMLSLTGLQQSSSQLDTQGVRAYQAARAGIEWGAWQVLDPNQTQNPLSCTTPAMPACPGATTSWSTSSDSLSLFTITVRCTLATPDAANGNRSTTEGNRSIWVYQLEATACNQPTSGNCPNTGTPAAGYVERQLQATLSKCKDPTATAPRCACG